MLMTSTQTISDADLDAVLAGPDRHVALRALLQHGQDLPAELREAIHGELVCAELFAALKAEQDSAVTASRYPTSGVKRIKALDAVFGDGSHDAFVSNLYDTLRAKAGK